MRDSNVISSGLFDQLMGKLPVKFDGGAPITPFEVQGGNSTALVRSNEKAPINDTYTPPGNSGPPPAYGGAPQGPPPAAGGNPGAEIAEAMYNYQPNGATDLALYQGQRIQILEKLNADWWRGKDMNSEREGIFPANYVRVVQEGSGRPPQGGAVAPYDYNQNRGNNNYYPPQQQQQVPYNNNQYYPPQQQQAPFPPASTNYYQPPAQQPVQVVAQPAEQPAHNNAVADGAKKFGSKLGNAAIFGAGASIGSNIVNSIF